jgi:hypothetical protein
MLYFPDYVRSIAGNITAELTYAIADICRLDFQAIMNEVNNTLKSGLIATTFDTEPDICSN